MLSIGVFEPYLYIKIINTETDTYQDENGDEQTKPLFRYYLVWNIEQTEGIEFETPDYSALDEADRAKRIAGCEDVVKNYSNGPSINNNSPQGAFYRTEGDQIHMPRISAYRTPENYYKTLFHELTHSTGAAHRLNRESIVSKSSTKGSPMYAKEELIAEMGGAFLVNHCGISYDDRDDLLENTAAYCKHWIEVLANDTKLIVRASSAAKRAVAYILEGKDCYEKLTQI